VTLTGASTGGPSNPETTSTQRDVRPTVSPAKNSLVYFISKFYIDHPVWRRHREEAKRGPPSGPRIPRNAGAMMALLLLYVTTGLSLIAGWCWIGATPRGQPRTPAVMLPHGCEGLRVRRMTVLWTFRGPFMGHPGPRQFLRNEWLDVTTIVPATAYHRRSYAERYSRSIIPIGKHRGRRSRISMGIASCSRMQRGPTKSLHTRCRPSMSRTHDIARVQVLPVCACHVV
jgi:hypothetical protein